MKGMSLLKKLLTVSIVAAIVVTVLSAGSYAAAAGTAGFDVTKAGASGSDGADDTGAIQSALDKHNSVYIPDGVYYINVDRSLRLRSNQTLTLSDGATLQALPSANGWNAVIRINNVSGVTVTGGSIVGERASHKGTGGEWGMGISVENGSSNISISNITISSCWGDGVYIGDGASIVRDVTLDGVTCDYNRRQGLSITYATQVTITGCTFKNTSGTAPEAGIDIEPYGNYTASEITILDTKCIGNAGSGLDLMGLGIQIQNITVEGCTFSFNNGSGVRACYTDSLQMTDSVISNNWFGIEMPNDVTNVTCTGLTISDNKSHGVSLVTAYQMSGISNITFESTIFSNNSKYQANNTDGIRIDRYDSSGYIKNVNFSNCRFVDDQSSKTQRYGITVGLFTSGISDIVVESSCVFSGNIAGDFLGSKALRVL